MNKHLEELSQEELLILLSKNKDNNEYHASIEQVFKRKFKLPNIFNEQCISVLDRLGYTNNTIYKEEVYNITNKFSSEIKQTSKENISYDCLSIIVITEILDYYNAKYNQEDLISLYDLDAEEYYKIKKKINILLKSYYWHK
jgi:hypothetical protein